MSESPAKKAKTSGDEEAETSSGVSEPAVVNWTPHDIRVYDESGKSLMQVYPKIEGRVARMSEIDDDVCDEVSKTYGVRVKKAPTYDVLVVNGQEIDEDYELPHEKNTGVIVSLPVGIHMRQLAKEGKYNYKFDTFGSDMSPASAVRDSEGRPMGCRGLLLYARASK